MKKRQCEKEYAEMENFQKAFIKAATRYAEYVGAKIIYAAEIKTTPWNKSKGGTVCAGQEPTASGQLCEEVRTLNAVAEAVRKMEEATHGSGAERNNAALPNKKRQ